MKDSITCVNDATSVFHVSVDITAGTDTADIWVGDTIVAKIEVFREIPDGFVARVFTMEPGFGTIRYVPLVEVEDAPA